MARARGGKGIAAALHGVLLLGLVALIGGVGGMISPALAQDSNRIAAVINDDIISVMDLENRYRFVFATTDITDTPANRRRLAPRVLRQLIDDTLKLQESERRGVKAAERDVRRAIAGIERQNGMQPGTLNNMLRQRGVSRDTLDMRIQADLAWSRMVRTQLRRDVIVGEEEVDARLALLRANQGKPEHLLSEIHLPIDNPADTAEVVDQARSLVERLRAGASFASMARQFSQSSSAGNGGDIGWIQAGLLDPETEREVGRLATGNVSDPLVAPGSVTVYLMRERRIVATAQAEDDEVTLVRMVMPTTGPRAIPAPTRAEFANIALQTTTTCDELEQLGIELGTQGSGRVGPIAIKRLPAEIATAVVSLQTNQITRPIAMADGEVIVMVCEREASGGLPTPDEIRETLELERLDRLARRTLDDLRRSAFIDIRL